MRLKLGFGHNNLIQKHLLGIETPRLRLVELRLTLYGAHLPAYQLNGSCHQLPTVAKVGAQGKVGGVHRFGVFSR